MGGGTARRVWVKNLYFPSGRSIAASSSEEIILRLHEIFGLPTLQSGSQDVAAVKNCSVAFFRDVFVDSDSAHILRSLRRPRNGIWLVDRGLHADFSSPLAESFLSDLRLLLGVELAPGPDSMRFYIFEQILYIIW